jgi:hypothetical protein
MLTPSQKTAFTSLQYFMHEYSQLERSTFADSINKELASTVSFLSSFGKKITAVSSMLQNDAATFNLFELTNISRYEARVHTPLLKDLLSPSGRHQQGRLFFDSFLQHVFLGQYVIEQIQEIEVAKELYTPFGIIDLFVSFFENGVRKVIVIENKIDHGDGDQQLYRYLQYLRVTLHLSHNDFRMVYLTPKGKSPATHSIPPTILAGLQSMKAYNLVSYRNGIAHWLESVLPSVKAPVVAYTIKQYIKTIKNL